MGSPAPGAMDTDGRGDCSGFPEEGFMKIWDLSWGKHLFDNPMTRYLCETAEVQELVNSSGVKACRLVYGSADLVAKAWPVDCMLGSMTQVNAELTLGCAIQSKFPRGHPLICPVLETSCSPTGGYCSLSMYGGESLEAIMARGAFDGWSTAAKVQLVEDLLMCCLIAAHEVHALGYLIRDFKPENIVYCWWDRVFRIIDLGLAIRLDGADFFEGYTITYIDPVFALKMPVTSPDGSTYEDFIFADKQAARKATLYAGARLDLHVIARTVASIAVRLLHPQQELLHGSSGIPCALHPVPLRAVLEEANLLEALHAWTVEDWSRMLAPTGLPDGLVHLLLQLLPPHPKDRLSSAQAAAFHGAMHVPRQRNEARVAGVMARWAAKQAAARAWIAREGECGAGGGVQPGGGGTSSRATTSCDRSGGKPTSGGGGDGSSGSGIGIGGGAAACAGDGAAGLRSSAVGCPGAQQGSSISRSTGPGTPVLSLRQASCSLGMLGPGSSHEGSVQEEAPLEPAGSPAVASGAASAAAHSSGDPIVAAVAAAAAAATAAAATAAAATTAAAAAAAVAAAVGAPATPNAPMATSGPVAAGGGSSGSACVPGEGDGSAWLWRMEAWQQRTVPVAASAGGPGKLPCGSTQLRQGMGSAACSQLGETLVRMGAAAAAAAAAAAGAAGSGASCGIAAASQQGLLRGGRLLLRAFGLAAR